MEPRRAPLAPLGLALALVVLAIPVACEISPDQPPEAFLEEDTRRQRLCEVSNPPPDADVVDANEPEPDPDPGTCPRAGERCGLDCLGGLARERCACSGTWVCSNDAPMCVRAGDVPVALPFTESERCGNGLDDDCDGAVDEGCDGECF